MCGERMSKLIFVDFETFGMPGSPQNIWQFAYGAMTTEDIRSDDHNRFMTGVIDWTGRSQDGISAESRRFTNAHTPYAWDWILKKDCPYTVYSLEEFAEATVQWFQSHGCYPSGANSRWKMAGRNPVFDFHCFPQAVREAIGLKESGMLDIAAVFTAIAEPSGGGDLPSLDKIKRSIGADSGTHHDALKDVKDEMKLYWESINAVKKYWQEKQRSS
jgi:hypothetical protein